jgi:S-adenosyl methyltransferase
VPVTHGGQLARQRGPRDTWGQKSPPPAPRPTRTPADIDTQVPHASRIYDYLLGGTTNFAVDRAMAEDVFGGVYAGGIDAARADVLANRAFLGRAVRYLAGAGIRQFLDIGTGIPTEDNVHQVAQSVAPESRIVYVDYDLIVRAHASVLLESTPDGATAYVTADLREPEKILEQAKATLDFRQPVALVLVGILHVVPDQDDAYGIVARLVKALPSGSYLVVSHLASDINPDETVEAVKLLNERAHETFFLRDRAEVARFFDGLELLEPEVVTVDRWRPSEAHRKRPGHRATPIYGAVGRKP